MMLKSFNITMQSVHCNSVILLYQELIIQTDQLTQAHKTFSQISLSLEQFIFLRFLITSNQSISKYLRPEDSILDTLTTFTFLESYTVKPLKYEHQRDRTKCPLYRGVRIIEVGNVWFLAFLGPNELSVIERCP